MLCKTCGSYIIQSCDDCQDGQCTMNCGPAKIDLRGVFDAADAEFHLDHASETQLQRMGRRAAVRGMMVRLGLYDLWLHSKGAEVQS